jgi:quercetin dioxygenase-like cupin family protein
MHSLKIGFGNGSKIRKICQTKIKMDFSIQKRTSNRPAENQLLLDEKIKGDRIVGLEAKIEPGRVHQLHIHKNEYVLVYSLKGKCLVTIGKTTKTILPHTMMFIPPRVPHRFYNKFSAPWEGIAFAIGTNKKINNIWME